MTRDATSCGPGGFCNSAGEDGMFLMFEPTSRDGENRQAYLERYTRMIRLQWTNMTPEERDIVATHVQTADYPETASDWMAMSREAGFTRAKTLFGTVAKNVKTAGCGVKHGGSKRYMLRLLKFLQQSRFGNLSVTGTP